MRDKGRLLLMLAVGTLPCAQRPLLAAYPASQAAALHAAAGRGHDAGRVSPSERLAEPGSTWGMAPQPHLPAAGKGPSPSSRRTPNGLPAQGFDGVWSLEALTRFALTYNPILPRADARVQSARADARQAGIWNNPRFDTNNPQILASGPINNRYSAGFALDIPMGKKRLDRAAGLQQARESEFSALSDRYDVLTGVRQNFYAALAQQERLIVLRRLVATANETRDIARRRYVTEQAAETEVLMLDIELSRAEANVRQAEVLLVAKLRQLAAAAGAADVPIRAVQGRLTGPPPRFDDTYVRRYVAERNVDVLNTRTEVARSQTLRRRAEREPVPNLYTGPAVAWFQSTQLGNTQFWYNIQFAIPVWDRNQGNIRRARAYTRDAAASVQVTQNSLIAQAADALSRHRAAVQRADRIEQEILPKARRNAGLVAKGYGAAQFDVTRVLQAQRSYFEANNDYIDALEEVWTTAAELGNLLQLETFP